MITRTPAEALVRYHAAYDNARYTAIRQAVIADIFGSQTELEQHAEEPTVVDLMNTLIDTCLFCCGYPADKPAHVMLARLTADAQLSQKTLSLMHDYLLRFADMGISPADDFHALAVALRNGHRVQRPLWEAIAHANVVHNWQGRATYHLLATADYLVQTSLQLLENGHPAYINEKLGAGVRGLLFALEEGLRHSEDAASFDFSDIRFPAVTKPQSGQGQSVES